MKENQKILFVTIIVAIIICFVGVHIREVRYNLNDGSDNYDEGQARAFYANIQKEDKDKLKCWGTGIIVAYSDPIRYLTIENYADGGIIILFDDHGDNNVSIYCEKYWEQYRIDDRMWMFFTYIGEETVHTFILENTTINATYTLKVSKIVNPLNGRSFPVKTIEFEVKA